MAGANKSTINDDDLLQQFMSITGSDESTALHFLEACDGDLSAAIGMHMDSSGAASAPAPTPAPVPGPSKSSAVPGPSKSSTSTSSGKGTGKRKRSHSPVGPKQPAPQHDDVRAPIPQKHEVLVQDSVVYGRQGRRRKTQSIFDQFRDFQEEARQHEMAQNGNSASVSKRRTLEDLFRPPIDLLHKGSFKSACESAASANKWLIVNVQNVQEFACQVLNRDVWSNSTVKELIRRRFVLWQTYSDSEEGKRHINLYKVSEWPYIAVIDPRTGEKMISWNKLEANSFCEIAAEFLDQHPAPEESDVELTPTKKPPNENSIVDASEDRQITAAIAASLKENSVCKKKETFFTTTSDEEESTCFYSSDSDLETFSDSDNSRPAASASSSFKSKGDVLPEPEVSSRLRVLVDETILDGIPGTDVEVKTCVNGEQNGRNAAQEGKSRESNEELWKTYLGPDSDPKSNIMLRFPDGVRLPLSIPCSSKLRSIVSYVAELGYPHDKFELVTTFPKRKLSQLDLDITLRESGLNSQETVFIQEL